jgi:hypothetical protein
MAADPDSTAAPASPPAPDGDGVGSGPVAQAAHPNRIWVRLILAVATVLAIFAIFAVWANRQLLNPENWSKTSTALLQKQAVRTALAGYLVNQLYENINVPAQLRSGLPTQLEPLAGPLSGALHGVAEQAAERALENARVQALWQKANRAADQTLVTVVDGGGSRVQINGGTVSLNLRQVVADLATELGLPPGVAEKLPASVADLKIVTSSQLGLVRTGAKGLHALALGLTILVFLLYVIAIGLSRGYRRRTLLFVGGSLVLAGLLVLVGRKIGQGQVVSAITSDASIQPAANDAYSVATSLLVQVASSAIIVGLPVMASAWLAGPASWAVSIRRFLAPHLRERPALAYWVTAALLALVFIWGPIPATRNPWEILLFTILAFVGAHILRSQIAEQFPDAEHASMRSAISEKVAHARAASSGHQPAPSKAAELERLVALHDRAAITDDEYAAAKRELLDSPG